MIEAVVGWVISRPTSCGRNIRTTTGAKGNKILAQGELSILLRTGKEMGYTDMAQPVSQGTARRSTKSVRMHYADTHVCLRAGARRREAAADHRINAA
jgi:hypothetical protein